jgi:hypothetical protein
MPPAKPTHYVVTANRLIDGQPHYLREDASWSPGLAEAWLIEDKAKAETLAQQAQDQDRVVCDPYVFGVRHTPEGLDPMSARERIRGQGPTTRLRRPDHPARP